MNWTLFLSIAGPLAAVLGSIWVARSTNRASPYQHLATRVVNLEQRTDQDAKRIHMLEQDRHVLMGVVASQVRWQRSGAPPPPPPIGQEALELLARHHAESQRLDAATPEPTTT